MPRREAPGCRRPDSDARASSRGRCRGPGQGSGCRAVASAPTRGRRCVARPRDLGAAERTGVEQAAVLTREGDALGDALVDDLDADLRQPVHVRLAGAEVATLHRVVEEAEDAVAVVAIVLGGVDAALG